jgi:hypothetical protein
MGGLHWLPEFHSRVSDCCVPASWRPVRLSLSQRRQPALLSVSYWPRLRVQPAQRSQAAGALGPVSREQPAWLVPRLGPVPREQAAAWE